MEMRAVLGTGLEVIHVTFWQRTCLHFVCILKLLEAKFKGETNGLVEEISSQHSIQAVAWVFLAAFRQIYSEILEQKTRVDRFEKLVVWPEKKY
jgi:hypothetical protein